MCQQVEAPAPLHSCTTITASTGGERADGGPSRLNGGKLTGSLPGREVK